MAKLRIAPLCLVSSYQEHIPAIEIDPLAKIRSVVDMCTKPNLHHVACFIQCTGHKLLRHDRRHALIFEDK